MLYTKFAGNFPNSNDKNRALELVVSARAETADEKLRLNDTASGIELFKSAVKDAPNPVSDKLFAEILLQIPTNLFLRAQQAAAIEVAKLIEEKIEGNSNQLLGLATFTSERKMPPKPADLPKKRLPSIRICLPRIKLWDLPAA